MASEYIQPLTGNLNEIKIESPRDKAARLGVPFIEPRDPIPTLNKAVGVCGQCGRTIYEVEAYVCANISCPVQPQIICG